jgi:glycine cleavage system H protein
MNFPENLKYTQDHEWVKLDNNIATIGITEYAQGELGDIVFVDIDPDMEEINTGDSFGTIEAVKTVSDLFAPCSGKVVEINDKLADEPQIINTNPYDEGWIIKVELEDTSVLDSLLDAQGYKNQIGQ